MSTSREFVEYILDLLRPIENIQTTRMFGGVLLKVNQTQLGVLIGETIYFKVVDIELQNQYRAAGSKQFSYTRKDKPDPIVIKNWWSVPEKAMDNGEEIVRLAREVLQHSQ